MGKLVQLDIKEIIEKSIDSGAGLQETRKIKIISLNITNRILMCDGGKILQLLINILSNSLRYAEKAVFIDTIIKDNHYLITIKDDGPGFAPGEVQKIFIRFYKGPNGNTGMGLFISQAIARKHGISITTWSASLHGAVFEISLFIDKV